MTSTWRLLPICIALCLALTACEPSAEDLIEEAAAAFMKNDRETARTILEPLAAEGHPEAGARLAMIVDSEDPDRAIRLAQPAIDQGLPIGRFVESRFEFKGIGRPVSQENALQLLGPLAECGMPAALSTKAALQAEVAGRELYTEAELQDITAAAYANFDSAQIGLALHTYYAKGYSYSRLSLAWLVIAAENGNDVAKEFVGKVRVEIYPVSFETFLGDRVEDLKASISERDAFRCIP